MNSQPQSNTIGLVIAGILVGAIILAMVVVVQMDWSTGQDDSTSESNVDDIEKLKHIDPALIGYRPAGKIPAGLDEVSCLAVGPENVIFVGGDRQIRVIEAYGTGGRDSRLEGFPIMLDDTPTCLAVAGVDHTGLGHLYVGFRDHVEVFDESWNRIGVWEPLGEQATITSIVVADEDIFAADAGNRLVWRYDTSGKPLEPIGRPDPSRKIPGFMITTPYFDVALASDGLLRAVNPRALRMEAYTFDGDLEFFWGEGSSKIDGFFGCCNPAHFAILSDGRFVTVEKGVARVKIYGAEGKFESVVAQPTDFAVADNEVLADVAVDSQDRILILDPASKDIRIYEPISADADKSSP